MEKKYTVQDILIGMFSFFPEYVTYYKDKGRNFNEFFFEKRNDYSVLNHLAFDSDGIFPESKELNEGYDGLMKTGLLFSNTCIPSTRFLSLNAINVSFKYSKKRFSGKELGELEDLSSEFRDVFC